MNSGETALALVGPLPQWLNFLIMAVAILLAAFAALVWAVAFRKRGRRHKRRHRRERHEHRTANPTLAEQGGLPPPRESEKSPRQNRTP